MYENANHRKQAFIETLHEMKDEKQKKHINHLKEQIKELIMSAHKKLSISFICKELEINRKTFYNNKLNEFLDNIYKKSILKSGEMNIIEIEISKNSRTTENKFKVKISESAFVFKNSDIFSFKTSVQVNKYLQDFKNNNEYRLIKIVKI